MDGYLYGRLSPTADVPNSPGDAEFLSKIALRTKVRSKAVRKSFDLMLFRTFAETSISA